MQFIFTVIVSTICRAETYRSERANYKLSNYTTLKYYYYYSLQVYLHVSFKVCIGDPQQVISLKRQLNMFNTLQTVETIRRAIDGDAETESLPADVMYLFFMYTTWQLIIVCCLSTCDFVQFSLPLLRYTCIIILKLNQYK